MSDRALLDDLIISELPPDSPTRRATPAKPAPKTKPTVPYKEGMFVDPLVKIYGAFAIGLFPFDKLCAETIAENAEEMATAWDEWAKTSPKIRRMLAPLLNAGGFAKVVAAHTPIATAIAMHHVPASRKLVEKIQAYFDRVNSATD